MKHTVKHPVHGYAAMVVYGYVHVVRYMYYDGIVVTVILRRGGGTPRRYVLLHERILMNKPPLGVTPKYLWDERRIRDLMGATARFIDEGEPVPKEWVEELLDLLTANQPRR